MTKLFKRCDSYLLARVFHPVAHYVDMRWHKNQFVQASWCVIAAMIVIAGQILGDVLSPVMIIKFVGVFALGINLFLYQGYLNDYAKASKFQEANPGKLAYPHHKFLFFPGQMRFAQLLFSFFMFALLSPFAVLARTLAAQMTLALPGLWLLLITMSMYFAGVLPPDPGARRQKQERALAILAPAPF